VVDTSVLVNDPTVNFVETRKEDDTKNWELVENDYNLQVEVMFEEIDFYTFLAAHEKLIVRRID